MHPRTLREHIRATGGGELGTRGYGTNWNSTICLRSKRPLGIGEGTQSLMRLLCKDKDDIP